MTDLPSDLTPLVVQGNVLDVLASLPRGSVHCSVFSPPFWGLRRYDVCVCSLTRHATTEFRAWGGVEPRGESTGQISADDKRNRKEPDPNCPWCHGTGTIPGMETLWGGDPACDHLWTDTMPRRPRRTADTGNLPSHGNYDAKGGRSCQRCGGWLGSLGLESTPDLYTEHMVDFFRALRPVMRDDGIVWMEIGDTYITHPAGLLGAKRWAASTIRVADHTGHEQAGLMDKRQSRRKWDRKNDTAPRPRKGGAPYSGLAEGNLAFVPHRVAMALQRDGWILRQDNVGVWDRPNPMPESVRNRSSRSHSYIFQITKNMAYYWDRENARQAQTGGAHSRGRGSRNKPLPPMGSGIRANESYNAAMIDQPPPEAGRNVVSVWRFPTHAYKGKHYACVDEETEALTVHGWKRYHEIADDTRIAVFDGTMLEWRPATIHRYQYNGEMVVAEGRRLSMMVTPNHRVVYRSMFSHGKRYTGPWRVCEASALSGQEEIPVSSPFRDWHSLFSADAALAELCGWILTDGHFPKGSSASSRIYLYQTEGRGKCERIEALLVSLGATWRKTTRGRRANAFRPDGIDSTYTISGKTAHEVRRLCPRKEGNYLVLDLWARDSLLALWRGMVEGDGSTRSDGRVTFVGTKVKVDFFQALSLRLGFTCRLTPRPGTRSWAAFVSKRDRVGLRAKNGKGTILRRVPYKGMVWCPNVPGGMWLARRNGKPFITGNTYPVELPRRCISIGTSDRGCCPECGAPFERVTTLGLPDRDWQRASGGDAKGEYAGESKGGYQETGAEDPSDVKRRVLAGMVPKVTVGWRPRCLCFPDPCDRCGKGWAHRRVLRRVSELSVRDRDAHNGLGDQRPAEDAEDFEDLGDEEYGRKAFRVVEEDVSWPGCDCRPLVAPVVLDPFGGSGTTPLVARTMYRRSVAVELSPYYVDMMRRRLAEETAGLARKYVPQRQLGEFTEAT